MVRGTLERRLRSRVAIKYKSKMIKSLYWRKFVAVLISILLLSLGWLGVTGLPLLGAFVPLLWISAEAEDSRRGWWGVFGWAMMTFVGWNLSTIWWIGYATPVGPFAATLASTFVSIVPLMLFHTISKRAPRALSYTALVAMWIAMEYLYTIGDFSWPWLLLGNGFSNDTWSVQWYEYTGIFGGSLWVLAANILLFGALCNRARIRSFVVVAVVPIIASQIIYHTTSVDGEPSLEVAIIQPNIDCYDKFSGETNMQEQLLLEMLRGLPESVQLVLMPETAAPRYYWESSLAGGRFIRSMRDTLARYTPKATLICGANTMVSYEDGSHPYTARPMLGGSEYFDVFNSAVAMDGNGALDLRHKARLVIGVENTPGWVFDIFKLFVIDLGGVVGQIGKGTTGESFDVDGVAVGGAICYEGLYGDFFGNFVRDGAQMMTIISNDGWWSDTPGHRHLYTFSSLRAIEHRRAIARCANTGTSGFIDARGDSYDSMGWDRRGVLIQRVELREGLTLYSRAGDYIGRISILVSLLSLLYYLSYRFRKRQYLVE